MIGLCYIYICYQRPRTVVATRIMRGLHALPVCHWLHRRRTRTQQSQKKVVRRSGTVLGKAKGCEIVPRCSARLHQSSHFEGCPSHCVSRFRIVQECAHPLSRAASGRGEARAGAARAGAWLRFTHLVESAHVARWSCNGRSARKVLPVAREHDPIEELAIQRCPRLGSSLSAGRALPAGRRGGC